MDETGENSMYPQNFFASNGHLDYDLPAQGTSRIKRDEDSEYEGDAVAEDEYQENQIDEDDFDYDDDDDDDDDDYEANQKENGTRRGNHRIRKKRKMKSIISSYRSPPTLRSSSKSPIGSISMPSEWTEHESSLLLNAWGEKFLQLGKKSLRAEDWLEVAEKVSEQANVERTDTQCRNRLDTMKKKYKKEKLSGGNSRWIHFKKMEMLLSSSVRQPSLSCGLDSGEFVSMNPRVYLNRTNGLEETRDSPAESGASEDGVRSDRGESESIKLLADSLDSFSKVFEKIERSKTQQMKELEEMRVEIQRELEMQKEQLLAKACDEIRRIYAGCDDDDNGGGGGDGDDDSL